MSSYVDMTSFFPTCDGTSKDSAGMFAGRTGRARSASGAAFTCVHSGL